MHRIVYVSQATRTMSNPELARIVERAQASNQAADLTGMLVGYKGWFLQVIEGPAQALAAIFQRIRADKRHGNIKVLVSEPAGARAFPEWRMAFSDPQTLPEPARKHVFSLQDLIPINSPDRGDEIAVRQVVRDFLAAFDRLERRV